MRYVVPLAICCLLGLGGVRAADDQPGEAAAELPAITHRLIGLFSPDREQDLRVVLEQLPEVQLVSVDFRYAEATFHYDADKLFGKPKPEQVTERFDQLLRSVSNATFGAAPLCATPKDKLEQIEIPVAGLDCKACCLAAYEAIARIDGVAQATASFREGRITALIDPAQTNRAALETALKQRNVELQAQ